MGATIRFVAIWAAAVLAAGTASAKPADPGAFADCDGYGPPSKRSDGLSPGTARDDLFAPASDKKSARPIGGQAGVAACDTALADPRLQAQHWRRKVSLLRARAMHRLVQGDAAEALKDLDLADATVPADATEIDRRSLALGTDFVRAYALRVHGEPAAATALATRTLAARPYVRSHVGAALAAIGAAGDRKAVEDLNLSLARLSPERVESVFASAFDDLRFRDVLSLYPQLIEPVARLDEGKVMSDEYQATRAFKHWRKVEMFWASNAGLYAYALAASGEGDKARAVLKAARERVDKAAATPPAPPTPGGALNTNLTFDGESAAAFVGGQGGKLLSGWSDMVDLRLLIADGKIDTVLIAMRARGLMKSRATVDLLDALSAKLPPTAERLRPQLAELRKELENVRTVPDDDGVDALFMRLPTAETSEQITAVSKAALRSAGEPFMGAPAPDGRVSVAFESSTGSPSSVEEVALLRAASAARRAGKPGLIIVSRKDLQHRFCSGRDADICGEGIIGAPQGTPSGYETRLEILPVDPAALPKGYEGSAWRVIDAGTVIAALGPVYGGSTSE